MPSFLLKFMTKGTTITLTKGLYIVYRYHGGHYVQSYVSLITLNRHDHIDNKFIEAVNIIPGCNNIYSIDFKPFTCEVRISENNNTNEGYYVFCKLIDF